MTQEAADRRLTPLERQLQGEIATARATPLEAFRIARRRFLAGERVDMQQLAAELGLHRTTLYRWVGSRDRLLGEIIWSVAEPAMRDIDVRVRATGAERIARLVERYLRVSLDAPLMHRFLGEEPEIALRVLTTKESVVQERSVGFIRGLLEEEAARGTIELPLEAQDLAYLIVRIAESFLYTPLITGDEPSPEKAGQAVRALLR